MEQMIAKCWLVCTDCEAYLATRSGDRARQAVVAEKWTEEFGHQFAVDDILCDGCQSGTGRLSNYCRTICNIRPCALEMRVETCAHCGYYACKTLAEFFEVAPSAEKILETIYQSLNRESGL